MKLAIGDTPRIDEDYYRRMRRCGLSPLRVREEWLRLHEDKGGTTVDYLSSKMISLVVVVGIVISMIHGRIEMQELWITSPSGKSTKEVQFYTALRIIRRKGWRLANVVPQRDKEKITRIQALKIILGGKQ